MSRELPRYDKLPWYRQFWPWFLIALPATVVVAGFTTLYIAHKHSDDLVADEYYKDGLGINRQLEKKHRAEQLGIQATLLFPQENGGTMVEVRLNDSRGIGELNLALSHPLESDQDFEVLLKKTGPDVFRGELKHAVAARWHWILEFSGPDPWRLDGSVEHGGIGNESPD